MSTSFSLRILPVWSSHTPLTAFRKRSPSVARSMASAPPPSLPAPRVPPLRGKAGTILSWASRSRCSTTSVLTPLYSWSPSTRGQRGNDAQRERRTLEEDEVVRIAVVLFKGEPGRIVVLYLADGGGELCPGVLDGGVGADLGVSVCCGTRDVPSSGGAGRRASAGAGCMQRTHDSGFAPLCCSHRHGHGE